MENQRNTIVILKQDSVFWLDKTGCWRNEGGKFRNKKIIDYFHSSIEKDYGGYFVSHIREGAMEKVYFRYEDTVLFVISVMLNDQITLTLNTGKQIPLEPDSLYTINDCLYLTSDNEPVKFSERAMIQISPFITEQNDQLFFKWKGGISGIPLKNCHIFK